MPNLTTVARFQDPTEALIVCGMLEAEGLHASTADLNHVVANWPIVLALGGVRVQVPEREFAAARELIEKYLRGDMALPDEPGEPPARVRCRSCGSTQYREHVPLRQKLLALFVFLFGGAAFPTRTGGRQCAACGRPWPEPA